MRGPGKLLLTGGLLLALGGMSYGLWYALFDEHQTLERMGRSLATGFSYAAERRLPEAHQALDDYAAAHYEYIREVDAHSHWSGLALLLILFGVIFDHVAFSERTRWALALMLVAGSFVFPLGVILQTASRGVVPQALAATGSGLLIVALGGVAIGFGLQRSR